jgi:hypothetical protein
MPLPTFKLKYLFLLIFREPDCAAQALIYEKKFDTGPIKVAHTWDFTGPIGAENPLAPTLLPSMIFNFI